MILHATSNQPRLILISSATEALVRLMWDKFQWPNKITSVRLAGEIKENPLQGRSLFTWWSAGVGIVQKLNSRNRPGAKDGQELTCNNINKMI